jgi:hypothetical protein
MSHFPVSQMRGNQYSPFGRFQGVQEILLALDAPPSQDIFLGGTGQLKKFQNRGGRILKDFS